MPRIQCRNCGKIIEVASDDAGAIFVCVACGTRNESPMLAEDGTAWTAMRKAVEKDVEKWKVGNAPADGGLMPLEAAAAKMVGASTIKAVESSGRAGRTRFGSPLAWAVGVVLVMLAIVLPFAIAKFNEPKKADYSDLMGMQQKAESLAAGGGLRGGPG